MTVRSLKCPHCSGLNLKKSKLGIALRGEEITFGNELFHKDELFAYGCRDCGMVFLQLASWPGQANEQAKE